MEWKRYTSALLGFPIVLIILLIRNKYIVDIAFTIISLLTIHEYFNAVAKKCNPVRWVRIFGVYNYSFNTCNTTRIFIYHNNINNSNYTANIVFKSNYNKYENNF